MNCCVIIHCLEGSCIEDQITSAAAQQFTARANKFFKQRRFTVIRRYFNGQWLEVDNNIFVEERKQIQAGT